MKFSRGAALFLLAFGVWSYLLWPTFIRNIWASDRSWDIAGAPTPYLIVHLVIAVVSLVLGTIIGVLGWRGLRAARRAGSTGEAGTGETGAGGRTGTADTGRAGAATSAPAGENINDSSPG